MKPFGPGPVQLYCGTPCVPEAWTDTKPVGTQVEGPTNIVSIDKV